MNDLKSLNDILFNQLEILTNLNVKDENFDNERNKAETVCNIADRIIKNSELELRNQVWQATRRFKLAARPTYTSIGTAEHYEDENY